MITPSFSPTATERVLPKLALDFTTASLDSRVTYDRRSGATYIGSAGTIQKALSNLYSYSEDYSQTGWTRTNVTLSAADVSPPSGISSATKITAGAAGAYIAKDVAVYSGVYYTLSVYARKGTSNYLYFRNYMVTGSLLGAWFNLDTGTVGTVNAGQTASITNVGDGWYRCTIFFTPNADRTSGCRIGSTDADASYNSTVGNYIYVTAIDLAYDVELSPYLKTTTTALVNPRFDYNPTTLACNGLLIEEARTNLLVNSKSDGTNLATQTVTSAATAYTLSFYGTGSIVLSGTHSATVNGTGAYPTRTTYTFTPTAGSLTLTVSGTVQYANLEAGSFATSFIATAGSAAIRNADVAKMTGTNFSDWWNDTMGSANISVIPKSTSGIKPLFQMDDNTANNIISLRGNVENPELYIKAITDQVQIDAGTIVVNTAYKLTGAWNTDNCAAAQNGAAAVTDTSATIPTVTQARIGSDGTNYANAWLQKISYWPQRITNNETQAFSK